MQNAVLELLLHLPSGEAKDGVSEPPKLLIAPRVRSAALEVVLTCLGISDQSKLEEGPQTVV